MKYTEHGTYEVTQLLAEAKQRTFLIPLDHGWIITSDEVQGKYIGEHEGIKFFTHFDKYLCMYCASEVSSGLCVARSFKEKYVIPKAKRRIAIKRAGFEKHMNALIEECGVLNDEEGAKQ
ncbi:hypothetical protein COE79_20575 [Bacillus toyonensis]|uniref:hypothetical protein n=1 Tax=Bacillus toyonensis TaxID=155322 RepID=UPI000BFD7526|nr:hypothetical protein [Bacillus toyonensis]PHA98688.1 hypothetical protein COE79_20575 [Bacillus toyonensis]